MKKICVTGASGYLAMSLISELIKKGYSVKGTLRNLETAKQIKADIEAHLGQSAELDFVKVDLTKDDGWLDAFQGCDAIMHTASPFPAKPPKNPDDNLIPAIEGTQRVLQKALEANVNRVIITSSNAAIWFGNFEQTHYDHETWTNIDHKAIDSYTKSKTVAEKTAWALAEKNPKLKLTAINPSVIWGPGVGNHLNKTSIGFFKMLVKKEMPVVPNMKVPFVDIRDVVKMHINALENDKSIGKRFLVTNDPEWMIDFCNHIRDIGYEAPNKVAPNLMMKIISFLDSSMKPTIPMLGLDYHLNTDQSKKILGFEPTANETLIKDTVAYLDKYLK